MNLDDDDVAIWSWEGNTPIVRSRRDLERMDAPIVRRDTQGAANLVNMFPFIEQGARPVRDRHYQESVQAMAEAEARAARVARNRARARQMRVELGWLWMLFCVPFLAFTRQHDWLTMVSALVAGLMFAVPAYLVALALRRALRGVLWQ